MMTMKYFVEIANVGIKYFEKSKTSKLSFFGLKNFKNQFHFEACSNGSQVNVTTKCYNENAFSSSKRNKTRNIQSDTSDPQNAVTQDDLVFLTCWYVTELNLVCNTLMLFFM